MDELIQAVANSISKGWSIDKLYTAILAKGWASDDAFLAIKAGELLLKSIQETEANKKPLTFRRVVT